MRSDAQHNYGQLVELVELVGLGRGLLTVEDEFDALSTWLRAAPDSAAQADRLLALLINGLHYGHVQR